MNMLEGKVAIITGASSGIGAATARLFAAEGAQLILGARRQDRLDAIVAKISDTGGQAVAIAGDVREEDYARRLVETALRHYGRLDVGFNNAGVIGDMADLTLTSAESWHATLSTNLTGAFFGAKHQIPLMVDQGAGSIIFTSSFVGHTIGFAGMAPYAASKAGLIGMAKCLAVEHGQRGIRVNALLPGGTRTAMAGDFSDDPAGDPASDPASDETDATIAGFHALKRMAEPGEIAQAALFLASHQASFVTGSAMLVDGGNSVTKI